MDGESSNGLFSFWDRSKPFVQNDSIPRLLQDCKREGLKTSIAIERRGFIFKMCDKLGYGEFGISGQTCRIMEEYMGYVVGEASRIEDPALRKYYYMKMLESRVLLVAACSMRLAVKWHGAGSHLAVSTVVTMLNKNKCSYTPEQVEDTELEILVALDRYIPRWTSVDMIEKLINEVSRDPRDRKAATILVQLAEYNRYTIEKALLPIVKQKFGAATTRVRTLHLAAGCVAAAFHMAQPPKNADSHLASLILVPRSYIQSICDVVIEETTPNPNSIHKNHPVRRRLNFDEKPSTSKRSKIN